MRFLSYAKYDKKMEWPQMLMHCDKYSETWIAFEQIMFFQHLISLNTYYITHSLTYYKHNVVI